MNTSEILHKAADLIEERGWGTGAFTWNPEYGKGLCLEGGIAAALNWPLTSLGCPDDGAELGEFDTCPAYVAVSEFLGDRTSRRDLWHWNDHHARNAAEVVEVLRGAAAVQQLREADDAAIEEARETARGPLNTPPVRFPAPREPVA